MTLRPALPRVRDFSSFVPIAANGNGRFPKRCLSCDPLIGQTANPTYDPGVLR